MTDQLLPRPPTGRARATLAVGAIVLAAGTMIPLDSDASGSGGSDSGALRSSEWALTSLHADQAWKISRGQGVTVAVIGNGVNASHPDLRGRVLPGADFGKDANSDGRRDHGAEGEQGTHAAGIIAGTARNFSGDGLSGLAPEARVLPLDVYKDEKAQVGATAKAIRYAARHGAQVINVSVSFSNPSKALRSAVDYALDKDTVIVTGAGDNGKDGNAASYPASYPGVVAVSATGKNGAVWTGSHHGRSVALAAPGVSILTTAREGDYWTGDGTAFAAPWVAASAALLRAEHPRWTAKQVVRQLVDTADAKGSAGRDERYGYGIVNPAAALADRTAPSGSATLAADKGKDSGDRDPSATNRAAAEADRASDSGALLTVGMVAMALIALALVALFFISSHRPPPGNG